MTQPIQLPQYDAVGIAEGFVENPGETPEEQEAYALTAWQHLIDTGLAWSLQGWFGRTAARLIEQGLCTPPTPEPEGAEE